MSMFLTHGRRYTMRIDGFASVNAPLAGGELITKPLKFSGKQLEINFSTSAAGMVRVELQDPSGKALTGFSLDDCDPIYGDALSRVVKWKGNSNVAALAGNPLRLRCAMEDADLFSLRFA